MDNFEFERIEDGLIIKKYIGKNDIVNIPEEEGGVKIIIIGNGAFTKNNVKRIYISDNIKVIGEVAFFNCKLLEEVIIGKCCTFIGSSTFTECCNLISYIVNKENPTYSSMDGVLMNTEKTCIIKFPPKRPKSEKYIIPDDVSCIFDNSFQKCNNVYHIYLNKVNHIRNGAFYKCENLTSVNFDKDIDFSFLGDYVFWNCTQLKSINLPSNLNKIGNGLFRNCKSLESIIIPETVTEIGDDAFYDCESLKSIIIPHNVLRIGDYAFSKCYKLENIYFEEGSKLIEIGDYTFSNSTNLQPINRTFENVKIGLNPTQNCKISIQ